MPTRTERSAHSGERKRRSIHVNWDFELGDPPDEELLTAQAEASFLVDEWADGSQPRWLSLLGVSGTGKTHLAKKIIGHWKKHAAPNENAQFWEWRKVVQDYLRHGDFSILSWLSNLDYLVIDDFGVEYRTDYSDAQLVNLFYERLDRWTVWTCNMNRQLVGDTVDHRIASRMVRGRNRVVEIIEAPDFEEGHYQEDLPPEYYQIGREDRA